MHYCIEVGNESAFRPEVSTTVFQNRAKAALFITEQVEKHTGAEVASDSYMTLLEDHGSFSVDLGKGWYVLVKECDCEGCDIVLQLQRLDLLPDGYNLN